MTNRIRVYEVCCSKRGWGWSTDACPLNYEISLFREFVREKKYRTEAEVFGWSFVFEDLVSDELRNKATQRMQVREPRLAAGFMGVGPGPRSLWGLGGHLGHRRESNLRTRGKEEARETHPGRARWTHTPGKFTLCWGPQRENCKMQIIHRVQRTPWTSQRTPGEASF